MDEFKNFKAPSSLYPSRHWINYQNITSNTSKRLKIPHAQIASLFSKNIIITGSNNGIGREAALAFAAAGANLILACHPSPPSHETSPDTVVAECLSAAHEAGHVASTVDSWPIDMASFASVKAFAMRWLETKRPLHVLCNNAGIGTNNGRMTTLTEDGFELKHQINFLSHALLTLSLLPSLRAAIEARVVCTMSSMHYFGIFDFQNTSEAEGAYQNNKLYFQTWLTELHEQCQRSRGLEKIDVVGVHPGYVNSGIWTVHESDEERAKRARERSWPRWFLESMLPYIAIDSQQGSVAIVNAASAEEVRSRYISRMTDAVPHPISADEQCRKAIWESVKTELGLNDPVLGKHVE